MRLLLAFSVACDPTTAGEICVEACRFYSECDPNVRPLESMCITTCNEKFADPMRVVDACEESATRHITDRFSGILIVRASAIRALECALDHDCPMGQVPGMPPPEDPCEGVEEVCLDGLSHDQRCNRDQQIDGYRCSEGYNRCIEGGGGQEPCGLTLQSCFGQSQTKAEACRSRE